MTIWTGFDDSIAGYPGLNGGCFEGGSVSFAACTVENVTKPGPRKRLEESTISLNGIWHVRPEPMECLGEAGLAEVRKAGAGWLKAQVPGEIHLDLIKAGQMPEPTVGPNMPKCRWPETKSWWYRTSFDVAADFLRHERQQLVFDGLDLYAQVFVNGHLVGEAANAFVPAVFDVQRFLQAGGERTGCADDRRQRAFAGPTLRPAARFQPRRPRLERTQLAAQSRSSITAGTGWTACPNIGIWRGVRLEGRRHVVLDDLRLDTLRRDGRRPLGNGSRAGKSPSQRRAVLHAGAGNRSARRRCGDHAQLSPGLPPGLVPVRDVIEIPGAKLWWPNGMGRTAVVPRRGTGRRCGGSHV